MPVMQQIKAREIHAALPAADIDRAKRWYSETLGLRAVFDRDDGAMYEIGNSHVFVYPSQGAGSNRATAATILVEDAVETAQQLKRAGVKLEEYDLPGVQWNDGVATLLYGDREMHGGWFKDSEGNILAFADYRIEDAAGR